MKILLDTHIAVWAITDDDRLSEKARKLLLDPQNRIYLSAVSVLEVNNKRKSKSNNLEFTTAQFVEYCRIAGYIELPGQMDNAAVQDEMLKASIFAMSSRSEGFPFVLLEAQSCGLPIVAYDVRVGPGFLVRDGVTGCLVPEGGRAEYEDKLVALMGDHDARARMGREAVKHASEFTREKIAEKWFTVIG